ncbi:MAG: anthranilate synthase component I family protein [Polyangiaceae bacterium]|nr:anthranilate synthase component I family protein [Polyangiaceae bacterium]
MLRALVVDVPPDPVALARRLVDRPGLSLLWGRTRSYLAVEPVATCVELDPEPGLGLEPSDRDLSSAPRYIGLLPYEARRDLERNPAPDARAAPHLTAARWQRYREVVEITDRVRIIGDDPARISELGRALCRPAPALAPACLREVGPPEPDREHAQRVRRALEHIAKGDVYVVNIARRFRFAAEGHPVALLQHLGRLARAEFGVALAWGELSVAGQSPELFLRTHADGRVETWPIKGTRPRGWDAVSDRRLQSELSVDPKELAELAMVVDVERNDLGRVAVTASVRAVDAGSVVTHPSVHHRVAKLMARLRPGVGRTDLLAATLPSGSVTGAPKIRAMDLIRELEAHRRGLYTGAVGLVRHDGSLELAMAIRTLTAVGGEAHYFAGGGIVADSDPDRETEETRWKALGLVQAAR